MPRTRSDLAQSPLRLARKHLGLSIADFAEVCNVHEQALYLNECGCYSGVLPSVEHVLSGLGFDLEIIERDYAKFQKEKREAFGTQYGLAVWTVADLGTHRLNKSPVATLRSRCNISQLGFAKAICVQPAVIYKAEKGKASMLPEQIRDALIEAGLSVQLLEELNERQQEYYEHSNGACVA